MIIIRARIIIIIIIMTTITIIIVMTITNVNFAKIGIKARQCFLGSNLSCAFKSISSLVEPKRRHLSRTMD